jgi:hypothetical protein
VGDVSIEVNERVPLGLPMKCKVRRGWGEVANCNVDISEEGVVSDGTGPTEIWHAHLKTT